MKSLALLAVALVHGSNLTLCKCCPYFWDAEGEKNRILIGDLGCIVLCT